jgi:glycosyltransferase involved in cell wall biosynthesis
MNKICVIIPVFNNEKTIKSIVLGAKSIVEDVFVINDGSTDKTGEVLNSLKNINVHHFEKNRGKGAALKKGIEIALNLGFTHAISMDGDGQHFCEWIKIAVDECERNPEKLLIGARIGENIGEFAPKKNMFARKFGNLWIKIFTGFSLEDTQSGFRVYPIEKMKDIKFKTTRFEFEQEVLIKSAYSGIELAEFAIAQFYQPPDERVSHYRVFRDSFRISLFFTGTAFVKFNAKVSKVFVSELKSNITPGKAAISFSLGIFFGIFPIYGFQTMAIILVATLARLNRPLALLGSQISVPPMWPIIFPAAVWLGSTFFPDGGIRDMQAFLTLFSQDKSKFFLESGKCFILGSVILAFLASIASLLIVYPVCRAFKKARAD